MKILFSSYHNPNFPTITEYIEKAIQVLGHELIPFDDRRFLIPGRIRRRVPLLHRLDLRGINARLRGLAARVCPDLVLVAGGLRILPETVAELTKRGILTVLWTSDPPMNFEPVLHAAGRYDFIFCQGSEAVDLLAANDIPGARLLPMACDPDTHRPVKLSNAETDRFRHDVVFVGSYHPARADLFSAISDLNFGIWGPGWRRLSSESPLRRCLRGAHTPPATWTKIYSASRIVLAPHYQDPQGKVPVHQASPRIFEAMGCGAFLITNRQRDVLSLFEDGVHLVTYKNAEELREKIRYFLSHDQLREALAANGRNEVLEKHLYVHRLEEIIRVTHERPTARGTQYGNRRPCRAF